jgi:hypothetical protein
MNGGVALLRLRGAEQIHRKSGLQLFTQLRSNIVRFLFLYIIIQLFP